MDISSLLPIWVTLERSLLRSMPRFPAVCFTELIWEGGDPILRTYLGNKVLYRKPNGVWGPTSPSTEFNSGRNSSSGREAPCLGSHIAFSTAILVSPSSNIVSNLAFSPMIPSDYNFQCAKWGEYSGKKKKSKRNLNLPSTR